MKIVVLDGYTLNPGDLNWDAIGKMGELTVYDRTDATLRIERIGKAEIVLTNKTVLDRAVIEACPALRYIGVLATGYNVVDTEAAHRKGIVVTNIPAYCTEAVAQYTFALILETCHRIGAHDRSVKAGDWAHTPDFCYWLYPQTELQGKTLGIIGYGRIGRAVARLGLAFGMNVIACSRSFTRDENGVQAVDLDTLLSESDFVSLHCPDTPETRGVIGRNALSRMKCTATLINTSRGTLVDEAELAAALNGGRLACAAVDVVSREPMAQDNPLIGCKNAIITPHLAWASFASRARLLQTATNNLAAFLDGQIVNAV